ncbi:MAG: hypothetical protein H8E01_00325 [Chloroflexi bacterium]|nr:hypothetical protein [Chloroflexota bacterium]
MAVKSKSLTQSMPLGVATKRMIIELRQLFPDAEFLIQGETYGPAEDVIVKIFVRSDDLITEIDRKAHELSLEYELETGYFIMPMTLPITCSPVKFEA